jgi:ubiquinone/menaquinone biosynthesis C-methylase UbiE
MVEILGRYVSLTHLTISLEWLVNPAQAGSDQGESDAAAVGYATTWQVEESLDELNLRIHDGVPLEELANRGRGYRDWLFSSFPDAQPAQGAKVLELGSGVGWIMEAMLERFDVADVTGLDVSENMIRRAQERFSDPKAKFVLYDGLAMPFPDGEFDTVYSVAAMQHIEKHVAFLLFEELHRILKVGGHALIHLLSVEHIPGATPDYHRECLNHVENVPEHWHHYYGFDELLVLFSKVIGVTDFDVAYDPASKSFLVHFSKGTANSFHRPELPGLTFVELIGAESRAASTASELTRLQAEHDALLATRTLRYTAKARAVYSGFRQRLGR